MSLFSGLTSAANTLSVFENALTATQNNVSNASTPGYVTQTPTFEAEPFVAGTGQAGGVATGALQSARDIYAEMNVRSNTSLVGYYQQQVESLTPVNSQFDISGKSGIPAALNQLFSAFSTWANAPSDSGARQAVLSQASSLSSAFRTTSANLSQLARSADTQTGSLVDQVNRLAGQIATYNQQIAASGHLDPGTDAAVNSTLERLSQISSIVTIAQPNGTFSVTLGGQTELVDGAAVNKLSAAIYIPTSSTVSSGSALGVPVNLNALNDTLNLKIDGMAVPAIKLSSGDQTPLQVATDINTQLQTGGSTATASIDAQGKLMISSGSTGANAAVAVLSGSANSTLNLSAASPPNAKIVDSYGNNVTSQVTGGSLAAALEQRNQVLPAIQGDAHQTGNLNVMAKSFADRVNGLLGVPLFTYDQTNATNIAATLQLNPAVTADQLPKTQVVALTGSAAANPFAITAGVNDTLTLKVDGTALPALTLKPADQNLSDVAADLNSQFIAQGVGAQASVNTATGALTLSTTNTGPAGSIQIVAGTANATLGLNKTTATYRSEANDIALTLAGLANPSSSANEIAGQSFTAFFGTIAANVGASLSAAKTNQSSQQDLLTQAQQMRQQASGVDLNKEATRVLELQTAYQAASKMINVIDTLTQSVLSIIPQQ